MLPLARSPIELYNALSAAPYRITIPYFELLELWQEGSIQMFFSRNGNSFVKDFVQINDKGKFEMDIVAKPYNDAAEGKFKTGDRLLRIGKTVHYTLKNISLNYFRFKFQTNDKTFV